MTSQAAVLIRLLDISIDGDTALAFTENVEQRFLAYGWQVLHVDDGDTNLEAIANAIIEAKKVKNKPTLIRLRTIIGYGSLVQGTHGVHGARTSAHSSQSLPQTNSFTALKADDIKQLKQKWGFPEDKFFIPPEVQTIYNLVGQRGAKLESNWKQLITSYGQRYPAEHAELTRRIGGELPNGWEQALPVYKPTDSAVASRKLSETVLTALTPALPELLGGSADLTGSNLTKVSKSVDFQPPSTGLGDYKGIYIRYGVREHAMGAIMNGLAAYGGIIPFGGTFLVCPSRPFLPHLRGLDDYRRISSPTPQAPSVSLL